MAAIQLSHSKIELIIVEKDEVETNEKPAKICKPNKTDSGMLPLGISVGVALGTAFGAATGNLALGVALGISIGCAIGAGLDASHRQKQNNEKE